MVGLNGGKGDRAVGRHEIKFHAVEQSTAGKMENKDISARKRLWRAETKSGFRLERNQKYIFEGIILQKTEFRK